jgi:hypothetical protein
LGRRELHTKPCFRKYQPEKWLRHGVPWPAGNGPRGGDTPRVGRKLAPPDGFRQRRDHGDGAVLRKLGVGQRSTCPGGAGRRLFAGERPPDRDAPRQVLDHRLCPRARRWYVTYAWPLPRSAMASRPPAPRFLRATCPAPPGAHARVAPTLSRSRALAQSDETSGLNHLESRFGV